MAKLKILVIGVKRDRLKHVEKLYANDAKITLIDHQDDHTMKIKSLNLDNYDIIVVVSKFTKHTVHYQLVGRANYFPVNFGKAGWNAVCDRINEAITIVRGKKDG